MPRAISAVVALVLVLAASGCGGDDEQRPSAAGGATSTTTDQAAREPTETAAAPGTETEEAAPSPTESGPAASPEDSPGGAGDEEPARTLVQFIGKDGQIRPRVVKVSPFIGVRVELKAADGARYGLDFGDGHQVTVGGDVASASTEVPGLREAGQLVGKPTGGGSPVRIEALAEAGP